ncbi:Uncharacterised protein [Shigella sonnei]|nr:Uncharacterised protein [Shigella sonnei]
MNIDFEKAINIVGIQFQGIAKDANTCIYHQDIQCAALTNDINDSVSVSTICEYCCRSSLLCQVFSGIFRPRIGESYIGPIGDETTYDSGTDTTTATEDENCLTCKSAHKDSLIYYVTCITKLF